MPPAPNRPITSYPPRRVPVARITSRILSQRIIRLRASGSGYDRTLSDLRRYAVARSLFPPISLKAAVETLGFVQADPIRAPARAQDLTLRHRVRTYHAGDLERRYAALGIEEDFFINYGFVSRELHALMHPRSATGGWHQSRRDRAAVWLECVRTRGEVHPREVDDHFAHGRVTNYWGGSSNATT